MVPWTHHGPQTDVKVTPRTFGVPLISAILTLSPYEPLLPLDHITGGVLYVYQRGGGFGTGENWNGKMFGTQKCATFCHRISRAVLIFLGVVWALVACLLFPWCPHTLPYIRVKIYAVSHTSVAFLYTRAPGRGMPPPPPPSWMRFGIDPLCPRCICVVPGCIGTS